jgi:hypothetical protein
MHQSFYTINKMSNSRFTVKEGHDANNLDATHNWSATKTHLFISKYVEGMIPSQWNKLSLYLSIRIRRSTWWVILIIFNNANPSEKGEKKSSEVQASTST